MLKTILAILTITTFFACSEGGADSVNDLYEDLPVQEMDSASISFSFQGSKDAILKAKTLYKYSDKRLTKGKGIRVDFAGDTEEDSGFLLADSGLVEEQRSLIHVFGNVRVNTNSGSSLNTKSLTWNTKANTIYTDEYVVIHKEGERIEGKGLETDVGFNKVIIKNEVEADLKGGMLE